MVTALKRSMNSPKNKELILLNARFVQGHRGQHDQNEGSLERERQWDTRKSGLGRAIQDECQHADHD